MVIFWIWTNCIDDFILKESHWSLLAQKKQFLLIKLKIIAVLSSFRASIWSFSEIKFTIDLLKCLKTHTVYTYNLQGSHNFFQFLLNKMVFLQYLENESVEFAQILIFCSFSCLIWIRKVSARAYFFEFFSEKTWVCSLIITKQKKRLSSGRVIIEPCIIFLQKALFSCVNGAFSSWR